MDWQIGHLRIVSRHPQDSESFPRHHQGLTNLPDQDRESPALSEISPR